MGAKSVETDQSQGQQQDGDEHGGLGPSVDQAAADHDTHDTGQWNGLWVNREDDVAFAGWRMRCGTSAARSIGTANLGLGLAAGL